MGAVEVEVKPRNLSKDVGVNVVVERDRRKRWNFLRNFRPWRGRVWVTESFRKGGTDPQTAELPGPRSRPWSFYLDGIVESSVGILLTLRSLRCS